MRKRIAGRKFKRTINQRKALFRSLIASMILNDQIKTTEAKAKAIRADVEKLITIAKKKGANAEHEIHKKVPNKEVVQKVINTLGPLFANRPGGYTRIIRLENRLKDNASIVILQFVEKAEVGEVVNEKTTGKRKENRKNSKKEVKSKEVKKNIPGKKEKELNVIKSVKNIATKTTRIAKRGDK